MPSKKDKLIALLAMKQAAEGELLEAVTRRGANAGAVERLRKQLDKLEAQRNRLLVELQAGVEEQRPSPSPRRPMRERVLDALDELGVPTTPRTVSDYVATRFGWDLPASRFASLRRDEAAAYHRDPGSRPAWVVPAINAQWLTALPRLVASSAWPAERRLVGSRTLRVNHLKTTSAITRALQHARDIGDDLAAHRLLPLLRRHAETVPGAVGDDRLLDPERVRGAVDAELALIEPSDRDERAAAALQLEALHGALRYWGRPELIPGGFAASGA